MKKKNGQSNGQEPLDFDGILDAIGDPTQNRHGGDPESKEAFEKTDRNKGMAICFNHIKSRGDEGANSDETSFDTGLANQTSSARYVDLKAARLIIPNGEKRKTRHKCWAKCYVINPNPPSAEELAEEKAARRAARKAAKNGHHLPEPEPEPEIKHDESSSESNQDNEEWWL